MGVQYVCCTTYNGVSCTLETYVNLPALLYFLADFPNSNGEKSLLHKPTPARTVMAPTGMALSHQHTPVHGPVLLLPILEVAFHMPAAPRGLIPHFWLAVSEPGRLPCLRSESGLLVWAQDLCAWGSCSGSVAIYQQKTTLPSNISQPSLGSVLSTRAYHIVSHLSACLFLLLHC